MNSSNVEDILRQVFVSESTFFVGAGISLDSGLKDFQALSQTIIERIMPDSLNPSELEYLTQYLRPEVILQIMIEELDQKVLRSLHVLAGHKPTSNHFVLAEALRRGNSVFTTNVDNLIERACEIRGIEFKRCYEDNHFTEVVNEVSSMNKTKKGCLFKLHGTIEEDKELNERYITILVALNQVGRGLSKPKETVLRHYLQHNDICFMGYSCQDDFSVLPVLMNTPSEKKALWLSSSSSRQLTSKSLQELSQEKTGEEEKAPSEKRSWKIINQNNFLIQRQNSLKIVGNWPTFLKDTVCRDFAIDLTNTASQAHDEEKDEEFDQWLMGIEPYKKNLIVGRLYAFLNNLSQAESYYTKALGTASEDDKKAMAKRRLGDIFLVPSTKIGDEKAIESFKGVLSLYKLPGDEYEIACTQTELANALRRRRRFPEATKQVEEARALFEGNLLTAKEYQEEKYSTSYARCLNIFGLIHYGLGSDNKSEEHFRKGLDLCGKSRTLKEKSGDVDGIAESDNAIALILMEQAILPGKSREESITLLTDAFNALEGAIKLRVKTGNFRGCFQHCRNLGLAHNRLANLSSEKSEKERYTRLVRKAFEDGMSYLSRVRPEPPPGEILECQFRIGELDAKLGDMEDAVKMLLPVESKRRESGDWHNRARTLDLLREAYADIEEKKSTGSEIISIYRDVLISEEKIQEIKATGIKLTNAKDILGKTSDTLKSIGEPSLGDEALRIRDELIKRVEQDKNS